INFAYAIAVGLGIAAATLTARRAGEKDKEGMGRNLSWNRFVSVNLLIIAKLGDKVLGLVGITDNYINFAYAIAVGLGIAAATLTARRAGEKDKEGMG
ncbi:MATE family efflux transporter, partial [Chryseobacterium sp. CH1]|uniref:MATE family efflux transporter n=1 Tax=Chryseobacterium sp. CH1 TaxID=713551 RepID=UPI0039773645